MKIKKWATCLAVFMALGVFGGCDFGGSNGSSSSSVSSEETDGDATNFTNLLGRQSEKTLASEETLVLNVNRELEGKNYMKVSVKTNVDLFGTFVYVNKDNQTQVVTEEFFIEASDGNSETVFKQFLDAYRANAKGKFDKILQKVTFTNKSDTAGSVTVTDISVSDREIPAFEQELYIEKGSIKVGADLATGGALTYLSKLYYYDSNGAQQTVDEVIGNTDEVEIGVNAKSDCKTVLSSTVNLINIWDAGRQFQQSYYANVGGTSADSVEEMQKGGYYDKLPSDYGSNGYERALCTTADANGYYWPYNPVQGGDCANNPSQIIDYEVTQNQIYVKTRAMDWAKGDDGRGLQGTVVGGVTTRSYMENWYTIKADILYVTNRFIDWNGFEGLESVPVHTNELPAAYVVQPLHNYVCYTGNYPWTDADLEWQPALGSWAQKSHQNVEPAEEWFAWVNDDGFGVGVYVPNTKLFASGRSNASTHKDYQGNSNAFKSPMADPNLYKYNKPDATYAQQSCYVSNTCYTAPVVSWTMKSYIPMQYQYAVSVDYLPVIRAQFKDIYQSGTMTNAELDSWN